MTKTLRLQYLFDPLCGWCYASAPALTGIAAAYPDLLELMPSELFSTEAQALMRRLGIRGVPQLVTWVGDDVAVFSGASLYQGPANLLAEIRNRIGAVLSDP